MKSFFSSAILKLVFATAIAVILINDLGSIASNYYLLDERAEKVASMSLSVYKLSGSKTRAFNEAQSSASEIGAKLTLFEIKANYLKVAVEIPPHRTWVVHRVTALQPYLPARTEYRLSTL